MPDSPWLMSRGSAPSPSARIFCFAHAGGNPRTFLGWQSALGTSAELIAVCMPGRGQRAGEPRPSSVAELAAGAAEAIRACDDLPIVLFGHSLGALVAFEVARRLRDVRELRHLVASGCSAPSLLPSQRVVEASRLEGRAFADAVEFFGGLAPEVVADDDLRELLLPAVEADVRLVAGYRYEAAAPLDLALSLVNGREDPHVAEATLQPWRQECRHDLRRHTVAGGHFHFDGDPGPVVEILRAAVRDAADAAVEHVELI